MWPAPEPTQHCCHHRGLTPTRAQREREVHSRHAQLFLDFGSVRAHWMRRGGPVGGFVEEAPKSKNAAKNAKRKAKKKAEAAAKAAVAESDAAREGRAASLTPRPGDAAAAPAPAPAADPAKEAKKILKKLRQIEQLKEKQAGGATLEATQLEKIGTEPKLRADLAASATKTQKRQTVRLGFCS